MKLSFIIVGQLKKGYARGAIVEYLSRIERYMPVALMEVKEERFTPKSDRARLLDKEADRVLKRVAVGSRVAILTDNGKEFDSNAFAGYIGALKDRGTKELVFIVGGPYGLHPRVQGDDAISLSKMTLAHETALLVLTEQVYRACTILKGEPYSH